MGDTQTHKRVNVGLIGLGEVAQTVHLPVLETLADRYSVGAICDVSPTLLDHVGARYNIPPEHRYADFNYLVKQQDLDAVLVLNSDEYHADSVIAAANHGLHVMVEKPVCLAPSELEAIIAARDANKVQVMVGYMRRFAPAFVQAVQEVKRLDQILYARIRDIIGPNRLFIDQAHTVLRPTDIPAELSKDRSERAARRVQEAIGDASAELVSTYRLLLGLNSHDLSAMRELIGFPQKVVSAHAWNGGRFITATLQYDTYHAVLETGVHQQAYFDAHLEVYAPTKSILVQYNTPYIRHLPTTLVIRETRGVEYDERVIRPTFSDPYTEEMKAFHTTVTANIPPKTTPEDYADDLRLFRMIVDAIRS